MTDFSKQQTTRRAAIKTGLGLLGVAGAVGVAARAQAQSSKADPSTVAYVAKSTTAGQICSGCVQFAPPNACNIVSGTIAPGGWCQLYSPKSA
jgi:hypothetical protein